jgi:hypothetical protein
MVAMLANERPNGAYATNSTTDARHGASGSSSTTDGPVSGRKSTYEGALLLMGGPSQATEGLSCLGVLRGRLPYYNAVLVHPSLSKCDAPATCKLEG